jgi:hypothetical protein
LTEGGEAIKRRGDPRSFVSGSRVGLDRVLKDYNRNEFHHLFPKKFLRDQGRETWEINRLLNFAFMSRADNNTLGGAAPSEYRSRMDESSIPDSRARAVS